MPSDMPYKPPSRQVQGRITEKRVLKDRGYRVHPNSGAGHIKHDGSDDETLVEVKDANLTYTLKGSELNELFRRSAQQGKKALFIVTFTNGIVAECLITKDFR